MFPSKTPPNNNQHHHHNKKDVEQSSSQQQQQYPLRRRGHYHNDIQQQQHTKYKNMYYPTIYSYKCYGKYTTSSNVGGTTTTTKNTNNKNTNTNNTNNNSHHGQCHGILTKLSIVHQDMYHEISRKDAIQRFSTMTADVDLDDYQNHYGGTVTATTTTSTPTSSSNINDDDPNDDIDSSGELQQQSVFLSPALIYNYNSNSNNTNDPNQNTDSKSSMSNTITHTDHNNKNDDKKQENDTTMTNSSTVTYYDEILPEEELIVGQQWTCYGVTDVEYLSLENSRTNQSHLVAVAPQNTGVSIRTIITDDSVRKLTRCSLGWIDILHDSNSIYDDDENDNTNTNTDTNNVTNTNETTDNTTTTPDTITPTDTVSAAASTTSSPIRNNNILSQLHITGTIQSSINTIKEYGPILGKRIYEYSQLIPQHMKMHCHWVYMNLQDDFSNRMYQAGNRIILEIPHATKVTYTAMKKLLSDIIHGDDDDDDNDFDGFFPPSGGGGGGGGGRRF